MQVRELRVLQLQVLQLLKDATGIGASRLRRGSWFPRGTPATPCAVLVECTTDRGLVQLDAVGSGSVEPEFDDEQIQHMEMTMTNNQEREQDQGGNQQEDGGSSGKN